jgi:cation transport ATPase
MSASPPTGKRRPILRLEPRFRFAFYGALAALLVTGIAWLPVERLKDRSNDDLWQETAAYLLMLHGGAAMATLMLLGALVPLHVQRAWRSRRNRMTGTVMVTFSATLIVTAFGLYYLGSEAIRSWASDIHIAAGVSLPVLLLAHILLGRRSS